MKKNTTYILIIICIAILFYIVVNEGDFYYKIIAFICITIPSLITLYLNERIKGEIKNNFDQKIETLKQAHSLELSKFSIDLNSLKTKENFKFTKLHEKRMDVLQITYAFLIDTMNTLNQYIYPIKEINDGESFEENEKKLHENYRTIQNEFAHYFAKNRIFFDDETEEMIDNYMKTSTAIFNEYYQNHFMKQLNIPFNAEVHFKASQAYKKISSEIVSVEKQIKQKFKELLRGVLS